MHVQSRPLLSCPLVLQELGHVGSTQVNSTEMLEELLLGQVENTIVGHNRVEKFLNLWIAIPAWTIVVKVSIFNFSTSPGVSVSTRIFVRMANPVFFEQRHTNLETTYRTLNKQMLVPATLW